MAVADEQKRYTYLKEWTTRWNDRLFVGVDAIWLLIYFLSAVAMLSLLLGDR